MAVPVDRAGHDGAVTERIWWLIWFVLGGIAFLLWGRARGDRGVILLTALCFVGVIVLLLTRNPYVDRPLAFEDVFWGLVIGGIAGFFLADAIGLPAPVAKRTGIGLPHTKDWEFDRRLEERRRSMHRHAHRGMARRGRMAAEAGIDRDLRVMRGLKPPSAEWARLRDDLVAHGEAWLRLAASGAGDVEWAGWQANEAAWGDRLTEKRARYRAGWETTSPKEGADR